MGILEFSTQSPTIPTLYIGLHADTPSYIDEEPFSVRGMAELTFVSHLSINPGNVSFQIAYFFLRFRFTRLAKVACLLWNVLKPYAGTLYSRYDSWLQVAVRNGALLFDADDVITLRSVVNAYGIQLIVVNCWGILPSDVFESVKYGCVNIHPSRLPKYRGSVPTLCALKNADTSTAVSIMLVDAGVDSGRIITQLDLPIEEKETSIGLETKIDILLESKLHRTLKSYVYGDIVPTRQVGIPSNTPKYQEYRVIRGQEYLRDVINKIQLYPYIEPGVFCYVMIARKRIHLRRAYPATTHITVHAGTYRVVRGRLFVGIADGVCCSALFKDIPLVASMRLLWKTTGSIAS